MCVCVRARVRTCIADKPHHSLLSLFHMTAGNTLIAAVPVCQESVSCGLVQCIAVDVRFIPNIKKMLEVFSIGQHVRARSHTHTCHISETCCSLHLEVLLLKLKALYSECCLSDHLQCKDHYCSLDCSICCISKSWGLRSDVREGHNFVLIILLPKTLCKQGIEFIKKSCPFLPMWCHNIRGLYKNYRTFGWQKYNYLFWRLKP